MSLSMSLSLIYIFIYISRAGVGNEGDWNPIRIRFKSDLNHIHLKFLCYFYEHKSEIRKLYVVVALCLRDNKYLFPYIHCLIDNTKIQVVSELKKLFQKKFIIFFKKLFLLLNTLLLIYRKLLIKADYSLYN